MEAEERIRNMRSHLAGKTAIIMLTAGFFISILSAKFYIEDSYAHIAAESLIGTPSIIGIFVLYAFIWVLGLGLFLIIDLISTLLHLSEQPVSHFFRQFLLFFLYWLLYIPLSFGAMYIGSMLVQIP